MSKIIILFSISGLVYTILMVLIGLSARMLVKLTKPDPNLVTPTLMNYLPTPLTLLTLISIVAAAKSTLDSILLTLSSCICVDILRGKATLRIARIIVTLIMVITIFFALVKYGPVVKLAVESSSALMLLVPIIITSIYVKSISGKVLDLALIVGLVTYIVLKVISVMVTPLIFTIPGIVATLTTTLTIVTYLVVKGKLTHV